MDLTNYLVMALEEGSLAETLLMDKSVFNLKSLLTYRSIVRSVPYPSEYLPPARAVLTRVRTVSPPAPIES